MNRIFSDLLPDEGSSIFSDCWPLYRRRAEWLEKILIGLQCHSKQESQENVQFAILTLQASVHCAFVQLHHLGPLEYPFDLVFQLLLKNVLPLVSKGEKHIKGSQVLLHGRVDKAEDFLMKQDKWLCDVLCAQASVNHCLLADFNLFPVGLSDLKLALFQHVEGQPSKFHEEVYLFIFGKIWSS